MPYYCHCVGLNIAASLYHQNGVTNNNNVLSHFGKSGLPTADKRVRFVLDMFMGNAIIVSKLYDSGKSTLNNLLTLWLIKLG